MAQQKPKDSEHESFVKFMVEKASKKDSEPQPYNHEGIDAKEIEELSKEIRDKGTSRKEKSTC